jgi:hypothetical protein
VFDWGVQNFSYLFPESLQVVSSAFIRIALPQNNAGNYRQNPGLFCIESMRLLSAGNTVYEVNDYQCVLRDYLESLTDEEFKCFSRAHLGYLDALSGDARDVHIPILLPNSAYGLRHGSSRGLGVWPADTGSNRLEIQFTMRPATHCAADIGNPPASISGACVVAIREVKMSSTNLEKYRSAMGSYSTVSRRFTELTNGFQAAAANADVVLIFAQPTGCVTEIQILAVPQNADATRHDYTESVRPDSIKLVCDSVTVRDLDRSAKVAMHNYKNGFVHNGSVNEIGRICFGSHASEASYLYTGAFNFANISQIRLTVNFPEAVSFKVMAVQLQTVQIASNGVVRAYLE